MHIDAVTTLLAQGGPFENVGVFIRGGGIFMVFILLCSLVAVAVVVHRLLSLRVEGVLPQSLTQRLEEFRRREGRAEFNALAMEASPQTSPMARVAVAAMELRDEEVPAMQAGVEAVARREVVGLQRGLAILEVVITIAPLLGLLGTVSGLISVFGVFGGADRLADPDPALIAAGIAEALYTTIAGLAVAVPVVIAHSYLSKKIETMAVQMEVLAGQLIQALRGMERGPGRSAPREFASPAAADVEPRPVDDAYGNPAAPPASP